MPVLLPSSFCSLLLLPLQQLLLLLLFLKLLLLRQLLLVLPREMLRRLDTLNLSARLRSCAGGRENTGNCRELSAVSRRSKGSAIKVSSEVFSSARPTLQQSLDRSVLPLALMRP